MKSGIQEVDRNAEYASVEHVLYFIAFLLVFSAVILGSWIEEDAFISFRVVDNALAGYGLRWNIHERVQAYTNPLWMLLHIPLQAIIGNIIFTTLVLSWSCLLAMFLVAYKTFSFSPLRHTIFVVSVFSSSTLSQFSTSGLEGPLLHLLFACFGFVIVKNPRGYWFWLGLITALSAWTRLDTLIFLCTGMVIFFVQTASDCLVAYNNGWHAALAMVVF